MSNDTMIVDIDDENDMVQVVQHSTKHRYYFELPPLLFDVDLSIFEFYTYCMLKFLSDGHSTMLISWNQMRSLIKMNFEEFMATALSLHERELIEIRYIVDEGTESVFEIKIINIWHESMCAMAEKYRQS